MSRRENILAEVAGGSRLNTYSVSDIAAMSSVGAVPIALLTHLVWSQTENQDGHSTAVVMVSQ